METAKSLLNVVYYYNGKLCGLHGVEHRQICLKNFEIGDNYIKKMNAKHLLEACLI